MLVTTIFAAINTG